MSTNHVDAITYLQVEPDWSYYGTRDSANDVIGARVVRATQKRPDKPLPGTVLVKITVRMPRAAFLPLRPEAVVVVPEDLIEATSIEVEAGDPS